MTDILETKILIGYQFRRYGRVGKLFDYFLNFLILIPFFSSSLFHFIFFRLFKSCSWSIRISHVV